MWPRRRLSALGRYKLRARIGKGGQGEIYRASCDVVVKRLIRVQDPHHQQRLTREFEAARQIDHPNVVRMLDCDFGAQPYIVMEYLQGEPLSARIARDRKRNRALQCVPLLLQAMQGVKALHAHGLIHRDLKPDNIFVRNDRDPEIAVVLDLGAVRFLSRPKHHGHTTIDTLIGTPGYMAPEQAAGQRAAEPADIYALGVILYEALVGQRPCDVQDVSSTASSAELLERAVQSIAQLPEWCSGLELGELRRNLTGVVMTALAPDPDDRYPSVAAFALALERAVGIAEPTLIPAFERDSTIDSTIASVRPITPTPQPRDQAITPWRMGLIGLALASSLGGSLLLLWPQLTAGLTPAPMLQVDADARAPQRYALATMSPSSARSERSQRWPRASERSDDARTRTIQQPAKTFAKREQEPVAAQASDTTQTGALAAAESEEAVWARMKKLAVEQSQRAPAGLGNEPAASR
jgi:serine/threonine protein kinase